MRLIDGTVPRDVTFLWRYGPLDHAHRALIRRIMGPSSPPLQFIGDLDPLDMAVYATLASDPGTLAVSYLGVSDAWLLRCEQDLTSRPVGSFRRVCIPL